MRDRNRASVIIWSICNEACSLITPALFALTRAQVLCNTNNDWIEDALRIKSIFKAADPFGGRVVSANQNGWVQKLVGPKTPLDVQGFDYSTDKYDEWHLQVHRPPTSRCHVPSPAASTRGCNRTVPLPPPPPSLHSRVQAPDIPSISSETSSAVSDRGEYVALS